MRRKALNGALVVAFVVGAVAGEAQAENSLGAYRYRLDEVYVNPVKKGRDPIESAVRSVLGPGKLVVDGGMTPTAAVARIAGKPGQRSYSSVRAVFTGKNGKVRIVNLYNVTKHRSKALTLGYKIATPDMPGTGFTNAMHISAGRRVVRLGHGSATHPRKFFTGRRGKALHLRRAPRGYHR